MRFADHIAAELRQHVSVGGSLERLFPNEESVARAEVNKNRKERELKKQKLAITRREKRVN